jgi:hypothetical protein
MVANNARVSYKSDERHRKGWISTVGDGIQAVYTFLNKKFSSKDENDIPVLKYSEDLSLRARKVENGKITLRATDVLLGDILALSDKKIQELHKDGSKGYVSLTVNRDKKAVDLEVDVERIEDSVKKEYPDIGNKESKKIIIEEIIKAVNSSIKEIAHASGGELKRYTDLKLLYGIAKELYVESGKEQDQSEFCAGKEEVSIKNQQNEEKITNSSFNMTSPPGFGHIHNDLDLLKSSETIKQHAGGSIAEKVKKASDGLAGLAHDVQNSVSSTTQQPTMLGGVDKKTQQHNGRG